MLLYRVLSVLLFPFIEIYLFWRVYKKKEDKKRLRERFGKSTQPRPKGDLIWIHAVSVGETNSALIFVDELFKKFPESSVLFTTTTLTSASVVQSKIPTFKGAVIHQFLPIDSLFCVREFLQYWRPSKTFFIESEIWPNLISEAHSYGSKMFLINARMSQKSVNHWHYAKGFGVKIFENFDAIFAQSIEDQKRFADLSKKEVFFYGNLKSQARDLAFDDAEVANLKEQIGNRKFWIAASTHKGEEEIILKTHQNLKKYFPDILTILIPRHPNRAAEIKLLFSETKFAQRSKKQKLTDSTEIYLADTLGELGNFYRLADFVFLGGSLLPIGGHNPFEPIRLNCAVITGPHVFNFAEVYENLKSQNACVFVNSADDLAKRVVDILSNPDLAKSLTEAGPKSLRQPENIAAKIIKKIENSISQ